MKKINLRGLQEKLSSKELKNVLGGSAGDDEIRCAKIVCSDDPEIVFYSSEGCDNAASFWCAGTTVKSCDPC